MHQLIYIEIILSQHTPQKTRSTVVLKNNFRLMLLNYDSIVFASPELSRPVEKKMSLHRKCLSLFPLVTSIYTVEKNMRSIVP